LKENSKRRNIRKARRIKSSIAPSFRAGKKRLIKKKLAKVRVYFFPDLCI